MRNLKAELKGWDDGAPVEWKPAEDGILVGYMRGFAVPNTSQSGDQAIIIEEESTGLQVLVSISSPQLQALFDLHNPRSDERIGIKYIGRNPKGEARFVMLVDRENPLHGQTDQSQFQEISGEEHESADDDLIATSEERDFIQMQLSGETSEPEPIDLGDAGARRIAGLIGRQKEELESQPETIKRFESIITHSSDRGMIFDNRVQAATSAVPQSESNDSIAAVVPTKRRKSRLGWFILGFVLLAACALAGAVVYLKLPLPW